MSKTKITYTIESDHGFRRSLEMTTDAYGRYEALADSLRDAVELFEARQIAYRKKYGIADPDAQDKP